MNERDERVSLDDLVPVGEPVGRFSWVGPSYWVRPRGRRCTRCQVVAVFGVPSEPQVVKRLELMVPGVLERCDACVA
jgi:hypothetical protein